MVFRGSGPQRKIFWLSWSFLVYVIFAVVYGSLSLIAFIASVVFNIEFNSTNGDINTTSISSYLMALLLLNLLLFVPAYAFIGLLQQYATWRTTLPPAPKPDPLAKADSSLKTLIAALEEPDSRARVSAVQALRTRTEPLVEEVLAKALVNDPSPEVRAEAYRALKFMGRPKLKLLLETLRRAQDKDEKLRLIELLRSTGEMGQVCTLVDLYLAESDRDVKLSILESLGMFNDDGIRNLVVYVLRNDTDRDIRLKALHVIGWYNDGQVIDLLRHLLNDPDDEVREEAAKLFRLYGPKPSAPEKVIITEIVKRPCPYCGLLTEVTNSKCPGCGATLN